MRRWPGGAIGLILVALFVGCSRPDDEVRLTVFAAASLTDGLTTLAEAFEREHSGVRVELNLASSSTLVRQLMLGAEADLYFSANIEWMKEVRKANLVHQVVTLPFTTSLVIVSRDSMPSLTGADDVTEIRRLAVGDPQHVPVGRYAREALLCDGVWEAVQPYLIPAFDTRAALVAARTQAAEAAIVYEADAKSDPRMHVVYTWSEHCQPQILYQGAILRTTPQVELAQAFLSFVQHERQQAIWRDVGFTEAVRP